MPCSHEYSGMKVQLYICHVAYVTCTCGVCNLVITINDGLELCL